MNAVKLDDGGGSVSVGAGARWQNVYDALDPHGLSAQGGRVGDVGVGGLTTGGNIPFFLPVTSKSTNTRKSRRNWFLLPRTRFRL